MVAGGNGADTSVELLLLNGTRLCALPSLPGAIYQHSQSGTLLCGGGDSSSSELTSCVTFSGGTHPRATALWRHSLCLAPGCAAHRGVPWTVGLQRNC